MTETTKSLQSSLYSYLTEPQYRILRHLLLVSIISVISLNQMAFTFNRGLSFAGAPYYVTLVTIVIAYLLVGYMHLYLFIPMLLRKKRYLGYLICSAGSVFLLLLFREAETWFIYRIYLQSDVLPAYSVGWLDILSDFMLNMLCISGISITVLLKYWMLEKQRMNELENRRLVTEVQQFKDQVNPGLLLTTLHKSSELVYEDPERTSEILFELSELLRYQLYDCNHDKVWLSAEISFVKRYLAFEKLASDDFDYELIETMTNKRILVSPMILMPLLTRCIENLKKQSGKTMLYLMLDQVENEITFTVSSPAKELISAGDMEWFKSKKDSFYHVNFRTEAFRKNNVVDKFSITIEPDLK